MPGYDNMISLLIGVIDQQVSKLGAELKHSY